MPRISPYALGATMYVPATRQNIIEIVSGRKYPGLASVVLCLEDAVLESEVAQGIANLRVVLEEMKDDPRGLDSKPLVFVRPRNLDMARIMASWPGIDRVDGFVAPKVTLANVEEWLLALSGTRLMLMPTLESAEMFDASTVALFRDKLLACDPRQDRILALRIGGNDLMASLGLRRPGSTTIYDGPLLYIISMLVGVLGAAGFALTSPVCEIIDDEDTLRAELIKDVQFGLVGKTAIHPKQIGTIHSAFRVSERDHDVAVKILAEDARAVFKDNGVMIEPATHRAWALRIIERAKHYGVNNETAA